MAKYTLYEETRYYKNGTIHKTYGITVLHNSPKIIKDISQDKEAVSKLVDKFNTYSLDPVHLLDAIEDFLYDLSVD